MDIPWSIAAGNDLRNTGVNFVNWYMPKLHKVGQRDAEVSPAFHQVGTLLAPPPSVLHPKVVLRVLMGGGRPTKGDINSRGDRHRSFRAATVRER